MTSLRRPRILLKLEHLASNEISKQGGQRLGIPPEHGGERIQRERVAKDRRILDESEFCGVEAVEAGADDCAQRVRDGQIGVLTVESVSILLPHKLARVDKHSDELDSVKRDAS